MKIQRFKAFLLVLILASPCFAHHLAVIVNKDNSVDQLTSAHLAKMFRSEDAAELKAHIAAHKDSIHIVSNDDDLLKEVEANAGAIAFVDVRSINDHVKVVKIDGKLPLEAGYLPH